MVKSIFGSGKPTTPDKSENFNIDLNYNQFYVWNLTIPGEILYLFYNRKELKLLWFLFFHSSANLELFVYYQ